MIVERINAASSNDVTYPTGTIDRTLKFRPQFTLIEKASYYILLDPGIKIEICLQVSICVIVNGYGVVVFKNIISIQ